MKNRTDFAPAYQILTDMAERHPDLACLDFLGAKMTYGEVLSATRRAARGLQDLGIGPEMRVGLCLLNSPYYIIAYFATLMTGASVVNFNPLYTEAEIRAQITDSEIEVMFTLDMKQLYAKVASALHTTSLRTIVVCSLADALPPMKSILMQVFKRAEIANVATDLGHVPFALLLADGDEPQRIPIAPQTDIAVIQYTGGTTGTPKGAMLTHANISANTWQVKTWLGETEPGTERMLCVIPFFHVFSMTAAMNLGLSIGAELILVPRFELAQTLEIIHEKRPTLFPAVPTIFGAINGFAGLEQYDLTSIRYCISGGAPLPAEVKASFEEKSGCVLVEGYGLSEASPVVTCNPPHSEYRTGSIGLPLPRTEIEVRDQEHPWHVLSAGDHGELVVRGPQVMAGYWRRPDETHDVIKGGWLHTGDIGYIDEDGYVFVTDRLKDIIICSGFKVFPRQVEDALYTHPDVFEAVVIGINDEYRGEAPMAFVTLKPGAGTNEDGLMKFCHETLNPIERPVAVEIRNELPKTLIGKISKKELVAEQTTKREKHHA